MDSERQIRSTAGKLLFNQWGNSHVLPDQCHTVPARLFTYSPSDGDPEHSSLYPLNGTNFFVVSVLRDSGNNSDKNHRASDTEEL